MRIDLREMTGRAPRCEIGLCKNRSTMSFGDATSRSGMGRTLMCDECAAQIVALLQMPQIAPETNETLFEYNDTPEAPIVEPTPVETLATGVSEDMTRAELVKLAEAAGLTFPAKATKAELIELLAIHG